MEIITAGVDNMEQATQSGERPGTLKEISSRLAKVQHLEGAMGGQEVWRMERKDIWSRRRLVFL